MRQHAIHNYDTSSTNLNQRLAFLFLQALLLGFFPSSRGPFFLFHGSQLFSLALENFGLDDFDDRRSYHAAQQSARRLIIRRLAAAAAGASAGSARDWIARCA